MNTKTVRALQLVALLATTFPTAVAFADEPVTEAQKEASEHFQRGVDFYRDGDSRAALIAFRRAYELAPNYRVLFNIGQAATDLQDYAQSLDAFEKYLAQGGADIPPDRRATVEANVKRLQSRVANLTITVNVPDAIVTLDDVPVGTSPLSHPVRIGAGRHKISASTAGGLPTVKVVEFAGGETSSINLELVSTTTQPASAERPTANTTTQAEAAPSRTPVWIGLGITGALAVGTLVMGLVAASDKSAFEDELSRQVPEGNRDLADARDSVKTSALVFDVLAGATLVAGGVTLVLALTHGTTTKTAALPFSSRVSF